MRSGVTGRTGGHNAELADVANVVLNSVAQLKEVEPAVVAERATANALAFLGIRSD